MNYAPPFFIAVSFGLPDSRWLHFLRVNHNFGDADYRVVFFYCKDRTISDIYRNKSQKIKYFLLDSSWMGWTEQNY